MIAGLTPAVVRVGDGRGFVVEGARVLAGDDPKRFRFYRLRYVITAAHCLPFLPAGDGFSFVDLLGPVDGACTASAECCFVDPVADIAVLGSPDTQELADAAEIYSTLIEATIADPPPDLKPASLLCLDGPLV